VQDSRQVALALDEIAAWLDFSGAPRFKSRAYERGARIVEASADQLGSLVEQNRLADIEGIGPSLSQVIQELWNSGESRLLNRLRSEHPQGTGELLQVPGLTPKRVRALYAALGIHSVEALKEACLAQRVRHVKGFGPKTEANLLKGVERWVQRSRASTRIISYDGFQLTKRLQRQLANAVPSARVELAGALRRGEETVGELAWVVQGEASSVWEELEQFPQVVRVERAQGTAHLSEGVPLHVRFASESNLASSLLFATGSEAHVRALGERVRARGLALTPEGLFRGDTRLPAHDERALYGALDLAFVPPELRQGKHELELAEHGDFASLLQASDIQGMVHCHTTYSDGKDSIEDMARAAEAMGMKYLTITDHSASAHYAGGVTLDRLKEQWDEIAQVQERVNIRILRGTESDILADGALDYPDAMLEQFDVVIASIHARHRMDRAAMTERLVRAMSLPIFKIWGHALGRILLHREPIDCDVPRVLDALAHSRGAIELNGDPHRLDLCSEWIPEAHARGIPFVVSVDAHSTRGLGVLSYGVTMARRAGLCREHVLNTLAVDEFVGRVRPR
jgi:DNA polymerase (family 10)